MPKVQPKNPMPRASRTLTIVLGPMSVGIAMRPLIADNKISAKTLCPEHMAPVKIAWACTEGGEIVPEPIKRYEYADVWVDVEPKLFEVPKDYAVHLVAAPPAEEIDMALVESTFTLRHPRRRLLRDGPHADRHRRPDQADARAGRPLEPRVRRARRAHAALRRERAARGHRPGSHRHR
jgi:hypothetical protein